MGRPQVNMRPQMSSLCLHTSVHCEPAPFTSRVTLLVKSLSPADSLQHDSPCAVAAQLAGLRMCCWPQHQVRPPRCTDCAPALPLQALRANGAAGLPAPAEAVAAYAAHNTASTSFHNGERRHAPKTHVTPLARNRERGAVCMVTFLVEKTICFSKWKGLVSAAPPSLVSPLQGKPSTTATACSAVLHHLCSASTPSCP